MRSLYLFAASNTDNFVDLGRASPHVAGRRGTELAGSVSVTASEVVDVRSMRLREPCCVVGQSRAGVDAQMRLVVRSTAVIGRTALYAVALAVVGLAIRSKMSTLAPEIRLQAAY